MFTSRRWKKKKYIRRKNLTKLIFLDTLTSENRSTFDCIDISSDWVGVRETNNSKSQLCWLRSWETHDGCNKGISTLLSSNNRRGGGGGRDNRFDMHSRNPLLNIDVWNKVKKFYLGSIVTKTSLLSEINPQLLEGLIVSHAFMDQKTDSYQYLSRFQPFESRRWSSKCNWKRAQKMACGTHLELALNGGVGHTATCMGVRRVGVLRDSLRRCISSGLGFRERSCINCIMQHGLTLKSCTNSRSEFRSKELAPRMHIELF